MASPSPNSLNFGFLQKYDHRFVEIATLAEHHCHTDPNASVIKARLLIEEMAKKIAAERGVYSDEAPSLHDMLSLLRREGVLGENAATVFHAIRKKGNTAAHDHGCTVDDAIHVLQLTLQLAGWFHRKMGGPQTFRPPTFRVPPSIDAAAREQEQRLAELQRQITEQEAAGAGAAAELQSELRRAESELERVRQERSLALAMAEEHEKRLAEERARFEEQLRRRSQEIRSRSKPPVDGDVEPIDTDGESRSDDDDDGDDWFAEYETLDWSDIHDFYYERLREGLPPFRGLISPVELGRGGWGVAYQVGKNAPGASIIVKLAHAPGQPPEKLKGVWARETEIARRLASTSQDRYPDGIVKVDEAPRPGSPIGYIRYEHAGGKPASERLTHGHFDPVDALAITLRTAHTLGQLLNLRVYFTDLHASNVVVKNGAYPKLIDPAECMPGRYSPPEWQSRASDFRSGELTRELVSRGQSFLLGHLFLHLTLGNREFSSVAPSPATASGMISSLSHMLRGVRGVDDEVAVECLRSLLHKRFEQSAHPFAASAPVDRIVDFIHLQCLYEPAARAEGPQQLKSGLERIWPQMSLL